MIYDGFDWSRWRGFDTGDALSSGTFYPGVGAQNFWKHVNYNNWYAYWGDEITTNYDWADWTNIIPFQASLIYGYDSTIGKGGGNRALVVDTSGNLGTYLGVHLDETTDEVTAYVTGTVHAIIDTGDIEIGAVEIKDSATDDRMRVTADGRAWVSAIITGSVDTELPAAATLGDAMANPTVPAVGAFNMVYNYESGDWNRWYATSSDSSFAQFNEQVPVVISVPYALDADENNFYRYRIVNLLETQNRDVSCSNSLSISCTSPGACSVGIGISNEYPRSRFTST